MKKVRYVILCILLLFINTGIQSNNRKVKQKPPVVVNDQLYSIPEFKELNESIQEQIKLNNRLDSLNKTY